MRVHNKFTHLILFIFLVCCVCVLFIGSQSGTTGGVKGSVKDAKTGEAIAKVKIILVSSKNDAMKYELQSDKKGNYYKGGLTPGYYKFTIEKEGFLPTSKTIRVRLGDTIQTDFELRILENSISRVPESVKKAKEAMALLEKGIYEDAVKKFTELISEDQANPLPYFYRGLAQEKNSNVEKAILDYQETIELKPDFILPYARAAKIHARQQNYEKAREFYQKSVELGDQDITTHYNFGVVLINLGKSTEAKTVFENLLSMDEEYADAYYHLGIISIGQGESERAKELLQKFIQLDPDNTNAPIAKKIIESLK